MAVMINYVNFFRFNFISMTLYMYKQLIEQYLIH